MNSTNNPRELPKYNSKDPGHLSPEEAQVFSRQHEAGRDADRESRENEIDNENTVEKVEHSGNIPSQTVKVANRPEGNIDKVLLNVPNAKDGGSFKAHALEQLTEGKPFKDGKGGDFANNLNEFLINMGDGNNKN